MIFAFLILSVSSSSLRFLSLLGLRFIIIVLIFILFIFEVLSSSEHISVDNIEIILEGVAKEVILPEVRFIRYSRVLFVSVVEKVEEAGDFRLDLLSLDGLALLDFLSFDLDRGVFISGAPFDVATNRLLDFFSFLVEDVSLSEDSRGEELVFRELEFDGKVSSVALHGFNSDVLQVLENGIVLLVGGEERRILQGDTPVVGDTLLFSGGNSGDSVLGAFFSRDSLESSAGDDFGDFLVDASVLNVEAVLKNVVFLLVTLFF